MDEHRRVVRLLVVPAVVVLLGGCAAGAQAPVSSGNAAVGESGAYVYWANDATEGSIGRASLDGTNVTQTLVTGLEDPCGVAVVGSFIYWGNIGNAAAGSSIGRANLDGTGANASFITGW